ARAAFLPRTALEPPRSAPLVRLDELVVVEEAGPGRNGRPEPIEDVLPVVDVPSRLEEPAPRRRPRLRDEPEPVEEHQGGANVLLALLPVAFLLIGLTVTLARDLARWASAGGIDPGDPGSAPAGAQMLAIQYHDQEEGVRLARGGGMKPPPG